MQGSDPGRIVESIITVTDLLTRVEFLTGLVLGGVVFGVFALSPSQERSGWGLGLTTAVLVGIFVLVGVRDGLALGLVVLAIGGWMLNSATEAPGSGVLARSLVGWSIVAFGGLIATTIGGLSVNIVIRLAGPIFIVGAGYVLGRWKDSAHRGLLGPLFAVTAFGVWVTVPDTELARILLGASVPLALATTSWGQYRRIGYPGAFALVGALAWIAMVSGEAREASVVGAWGAIGLLAILPLLGPSADELPGWSVMVAHAAIVVIATRVIGLWSEPEPALIATICLLGISHVVLGRVSKGLTSVKGPGSRESDA